MKMNDKAKPFVKWVGGKTQLLEQIDNLLPRDFMRCHDIVYVEPFVGGGAVLYWLLQKYGNIRKAVINDINKELITTYKIVKERPEQLVSILQTMQDEYMSLPSEGQKEYYLHKRAAFNSKGSDDTTLAALFIFLNKTCFNGLYRVNSKGAFNVPHGRYANPKICDAATIYSDSELLQRVEIICGDFSQTEKYSGYKTLFYFDPPYKPLSKTSSFTSYAENRFDDDEQIRLRDFCTRISRGGSRFILSNSDTGNTDEGEPFFDTIYKIYDIQRVWASRMINSVGDRRGKLSELMISNFNTCRNDETRFQ